MPQAPKSGNVLKIKQQVVRNKSSINKTQQTNSMTTTQATIQQRSNGNSLHIQQSSSGPKKKQILHTTKNVSGQTHQHNFDMLEHKQHMTSVQHNSNTRKSLNPQALSSGSNFSKQNTKSSGAPVKSL